MKADALFGRTRDRGYEAASWLGYGTALGIPIILALALLGCSTGKQEAASLRFPRQVLEAPAPVREAYQFAATHPEMLRYLPCYCGCVSVGHTSNLDCFIPQIDADGTVHTDPMGFG